MLSRKPTAIKLTQEDLQEYDTIIAEQQDSSQSSQESLVHDNSRKPTTVKGKEVAKTAEDRQNLIDQRIGVGTSTTRNRR